MRSNQIKSLLTLGISKSPCLRMYGCFLTPVLLSLVRSVVLGLAVVLIYSILQISAQNLQQTNTEMNLGNTWQTRLQTKTHLRYVHRPSQASSRCLAAKRFCSDEKTPESIIHIISNKSKLFMNDWSPLASRSLFLSASRSSLVWLLFTPRALITSRRARAALVWGRSLAGRR